MHYSIILKGIALLIFLISGASAQNLLKLGEQNHMCSFAPNEVIESNLYTFASSAQAEEMVSRIVSTIGLVPRFEVFAANVPNAAAVIHNGQRLIVYSENWIQNSIGNDEWAATALLAHEIAHHLNGHTLDDGGSRPPTELEADSFAGYVIGKMGGDLDAAQSLFRTLPSAGSETHPPQSARLEAVTVGWRNATSTKTTGGSGDSVENANCFQFDGELVCD